VAHARTACWQNCTVSGTAIDGHTIQGVDWTHMLLTVQYSLQKKYSKDIVTV
jgi:hypothetical protein